MTVPRDYAALRIDEPELCNRYAGLMIVGVEIGESPLWMQDRLRKAGMRPISNVVDITNYVMLEMGQPLHAFDYDILVRAPSASVMTGRPSLSRPQRRARSSRRWTTSSIRWMTTMLMIADTAGSIAVAGVMGGLESEVSDDTRNVLLEAATFEGINNRRTAQKLRISSEASYRFARGVPATLNPLAARRAAELMRQYAGGRVVPGMVDEYPVEQAQPLVYTTVSDMRRILGMPSLWRRSRTPCAGWISRCGVWMRPAQTPMTEATFGLHRDEGETLLECVPPWYRLDIRMPADLVEEVARMVGYEKVGITLLDEPLPPQRRNEVWETQEASPRYPRARRVAGDHQPYADHAGRTCQAGSRGHRAGGHRAAMLRSPIRMRRNAWRCGARCS